MREKTITPSYVGAVPSSSEEANARSLMVSQNKERRFPALSQVSKN